MNVYISIGNSDDKLTQREWADFQTSTDACILVYASAVHGRWVSLSDAPWQNACWCIEIREADARPLRRELANTAAEYRQESIAWAVADTEFLTPHATPEPTP